MMTDDFKLLDAVALTEALPEKNLVPGHVGTIVEILDDGVFEVEFCDNDGKTYALVTLQDAQLMALHYTPVAA